MNIHDLGSSPGKYRASLPQRPLPGKARSRWRRAFPWIGLGMVLAFLGLFFFKSGTRSGGAIFLPLVVDGYQAPVLGDIAWAEGDAKVVAASFTRDWNQRPQATREAWVRQLHQLKDQAFSASAVIYCKGFAARDEQGQWCLLPQDADPLQPATWLPIRTILEQARAAAAAHKLILFDLATPPQGFTLGMVDADPVSGIVHEVKAVPDSTRLVLCSCAPGQMSLGSAIQETSLFAHYWREGMARQGRITVRALANYMRERVDRAARELRGRRQTPILLGEGTDFSLACLSPGGGHPPAQESRSYPDWLQEAWHWRDQVWDDGAFASAPRQFQKIQMRLLQAEAAWREGLPEAELNRRFKAAQETDRADFGRRIKQAWPRVISLAQDDSARNLPWIQDIAAALSALHHELLEVSEKNRGRRLAYRLGQLRGKHPQADARDWEAAAWSWIREQVKVEPEQIQIAADLVGGEGPPHYAETMILFQLADLAQRVEANGWPTQLADRLIHAVHRQGQTLRRAAEHGGGPASIAVPCQLLHDGMVQFIADRFASPEEAGRLLEEAVAKFQATADQASCLDQLRRRHLGLFVHTPWMMPSAQDLNAFGPRLFQGRHDLDLEMDQGSGDRLAAADTLAKEWRQAAGVPSMAQFQELEGKSRQPDADGKLADHIEYTLRQPAFTLRANQRKALNLALANLDKKALEKLGQNNGLDEPGVPPPDDALAEVQVRGQAVARAEGWVGFLALAELPVADLETARQELGKLRHDATPGQWARAEAAVRYLMAVSLPGQWDKLEDDAGKARLAVFFPGSVHPKIDDEPTRRRRQQATLQMQTWLAGWHQYLARDWEQLAAQLPGAGRAARFCSQAAKDLGAPPGPDDSVLLKPYPLTQRLTETKPTQSFTLEIIRKAFGELTVDLTVPPRSELAVGPTALVYPSRPPKREAQHHQAEIQVEWRPRSRTGTSSVPGFLARARCEGRSYHALIPVAVQAVRGEVQIVVSTNGKEPHPPVNEIRLTPGAERQIYHVYLQNLTDQPRRVAVEARAGDLPWPGPPPEVALEPNQTRRVVLGDALAARQPLVDCSGPLELRVIEMGGSRRVLDSKTIPLRINPPVSAPEVVKVSKVPALRLFADRCAKPSAKHPLKFAIGDAPAGASLEVRLIPGPHDDSASGWVKRFPQARDRRICFGLAGGLVFEARDTDWTLDFDTRRLHGACQLQVRLLDAAGKELDLERRELIIDNDPPSVARVVDCPRKAERGAAIYVKAEGRDEESGIAEVFFFVGRSQGEQIPEGVTTVPGTPLCVDNTIWSAKVTLPMDAKGPTPITVRFVNGVGLARCVTQLVEATEIDPALLEPGRIEGKVLEGDRPQPGLTVFLRDEQGREKARMQTTADGSFVFSALPAGPYQIFCVKPETGRRALVPVRVAPSRAVPATLRLSF